MDTKTLVVGEKVHMITCECYAGKDGTVVKVTPSGVEVRAIDGGLYRFDNKGYELDADRRERLGFGQALNPTLIPFSGSRLPSSNLSIWLTSRCNILIVQNPAQGNLSEIA